MIKFVVRALGVALVLLGATGAVRAEMIRDLYSAQVPVADQSSAELARASRTAMSEVLVKVSGKTQVLNNPAIVAALQSARNQVQRYSYSEDANAPQGLVVKVLFDQSYITGLLIEAGAPIWTANRPAVLVWLVMDEPTGRAFVNADTASSLVAMLRTEFARRGVQVRFPLYDLADTAALSPEQAWGLDTPALLLASARYNLQDVLAGRFSRLAGGEIVGDWSYLYADSQTPRSARVENEDLFLRDGVDLVAEAMAARYAVAASVVDGGLNLTVTGVTGYADYASIVAWLESLELVERANVESVRGDTITLRLQAQVDATQLAAIIELNRRLVPLPAVGPGPELNYQWQN